MYQAHFGMTDLPFRIAPDPRYYLDTASNRAALAALLEGLARGDEFLLLTGDVGAGKTTVARQWLEEVDRRRYTVGEIFGSHDDGDALLDAVVQAFGVRGPHPGDAFLALERFVEQRGRGKRELLLLVDEAQDLGIDALRRLAQLTAMRAGGRGVLHVGLVGHHPPAALEALARLGQPLPIGTTCRLRPFDAAETREYVLHRLERAGWSGQPAFGAAATYAIHECSAGIPRRINLLCDRILLWQFMEGEQEVSAQAVHRVNAQLQSELGGRAAAQPPLPDQVPVLDLAAIVSSFEPPPAPDRAASAAVDEDEPAYEAEPAPQLQTEATDEVEPEVDAEPDYEVEQAYEAQDSPREETDEDDDDEGFVTPDNFGQLRGVRRDAGQSLATERARFEPPDEDAFPRHGPGAERGPVPTKAPGTAAPEHAAAPPQAGPAASPWPRSRWSLPVVGALVLVVLALLVWQGVRSYMGGFVRTPPLDRAGVMGSGVNDAPGAGPSSRQDRAAAPDAAPTAPPGQTVVSPAPTPVAPAAPAVAPAARQAPATAGPPAATAPRAPRSAGNAPTQAAARGAAPAAGPPADVADCSPAARTLGLCSSPVPPAPAAQPQPPAPPAAAAPEVAPRGAAPPCEPARAALGLCPPDAAHP